MHLHGVHLFACEHAESARQIGVLPDQRDVEDALIVRKMERDFRLGRHRETFTCSDCLERKHWLDIPGNIQEKLALRLMRKCGCNK